MGSKLTSDEGTSASNAEPGIDNTSGGESDEKGSETERKLHASNERGLKIGGWVDDVQSTEEILSSTFASFYTRPSIIMEWNGDN